MVDVASVIERAGFATLTLVFLLSVLPKVRAPSGFAKAVMAYQILPPSAARLASYTIIFIEFMLAMAFFTGVLPTWTLPIAALVLTTFLIATTINLRRRRDIPCACFGDQTERISTRSVARLLILLALVLALYVSELTNSGSLPSGTGILPITVGQGIDFVLATLAGIGLFLIGMWILEAPRFLRASAHNTPPP